MSDREPTMANPNGTGEMPRCQAIAKGTREQCRNASMVGLSVCDNHGGLAPMAVRKSLQAKERRHIVGQMSRYVTPLPSNHPEADIVVGFEMEYRRTVARIHFLDEQIAKLHEDELGWGKTKVEHIGASEFEGTNVTHEARVNVLVEMQRWERTHLLAIEKIWIGAKLDVARLEIQKAYVDRLDMAITGILGALGHDVNDPDVRRVVRDRLAAIPQKEIESG